MIQLVIFLAGLGTGALGAVAIAILRRPLRELPPATKRQLARARRAKRLMDRAASPSWLSMSDFTDPDQETR